MKTMNFRKEKALKVMVQEYKPNFIIINPKKERCILFCKKDLTVFVL